MMIKPKFALCFLLSLVPCLGIEMSTKMMTFLQDFGYLPPPDPYSGALKTQTFLINALKEFQEYAGIPVTGKVDDATIYKFSQPRCGMKDNVRKRTKRFAIKGVRWQRKELTYQIVNWTNDLARIDVARTIKKALKKWEAASNLKLKYKRHGVADIMIRFVRRSHNDQYAFDGPGGTLAHAFFPGNHPLAGDTHFDDDETFTVRSSKGKDLYWVALHEFGHALGLDHTKTRGTVMYPWYDGYKGHDMELSEDDVRGIQYLYGKPKNYKYKVFKPTQRPKPNPTPCVERVRAITSNRKLGETLIINGETLYIYDDRNLKKRRGPIPLSKYLTGGLERVDAAYTLPNGNSIYISGLSSWEYNGRRLIRKDILLSRRGFSDEIYDIDAAFYWSKARKVYVFKGNLYWRYDPYRRKIDNEYPKLIRDGWTGIPDNIDGVFEWSNKVFFFKGHRYYRFDEDRFEVIKGYPKSISNTFFVCAKRPQVSRLTANEPLKNGERTSSSQRLLNTWSFIFSMLYMVVYTL